MSISGTKRSWRAGFDQTAPKADQRMCDHPGCRDQGQYRAPKGRDQLDQYYWFCLDHVRAYNAAWDFYKGMNEREIEAEIRKSTTWQRETWPMGAKTSSRRFQFAIDDPFGVYEQHVEDPRQARAKPPTPEEQAMQVLQLTPPVTVAALKARYKQLVKQHHPDANGGDKDAEEKFKQINQAYTTVLASLTA